MKDYHDQKSNVQASTLKAGDNTLIKKQNTAFDKDPLKIVKTKGSMITSQQGNRQVTRNSSYFKKTNFKPLLQSDSDDQHTVSDNGCELVTDSAEGNNATSSPTHLHLERLTLTCPVQDLYHHPLESQQECPKEQPGLLR